MTTELTLPTRHDLERGELHAALSDPALDSMNFLNEVTFRYPEAISFAPGRPYDGFFDLEQIFTGVRGYLEHLAAAGRSPEQIRSELFQYGPAAGSIRGVLADWLRTDEGIEVPPESIVVTVGCQEAMVLALRALIRGPRDALLVSSPCYVGITGAARLLDIEPVPVAEREDGLHVPDLAEALRGQLALGRRPRAFYLVPDHTNPSGMTLPLDARRELLELAEEFDLLILEDSPYRLVSGGSRLPTLKALDQNRRVVHLGSFSKTLFPGARVGFAIADQIVRGPDPDRPGLLADELAKVKSMITVNTSPLSQAAVAGMLLAGGGSAADITREPSAHYDDAMSYTLECLDTAFPAERRELLGLRWNRPRGGFFLALNVAFTADDAALARSAENYGVLWTPMSYFYPDGGGERALRLSISYLNRAQIAEGVGRLARFINDESSGR
jgi:(S)-3,5-dihydroxyphenylglycine transaminase